MLAKTYSGEVLPPANFVRFPPPRGRLNGAVQIPTIERSGASFLSLPP